MSLQDAAKLLIIFQSTSIYTDFYRVLNRYFFKILGNGFDFASRGCQSLSSDESWSLLLRLRRAVRKIEPKSAELLTDRMIMSELFLM